MVDPSIENMFNLGILDLFTILKSVLKLLWPIILLLVGVMVFMILKKWIISLFRKSKAKKQWRQIKSLQELQKMDPRDFEKFVGEIFKNLGFKNVKVVGKSGDEGIDIKALNKNNEKCLIQCKRYGHKVSVGKVRDFYGAMADKGIDRGYFVTTNFFTLDAERFCDNKPIGLIDGNKLIKYIRLAEKSKNKSGSKVCPKCAGKLEERVGRFGKFLGCSNYPKCQHTEDIKK